MSSFVSFDPPSEIDEVAQNLRTLLGTPVGSVPLDRAFGVMVQGLDDPLPAVQAYMSRDIIDAVARYEPRAEVTAVDLVPDNLTGRLSARVGFRMKDGGGAGVVSA